MVVADVAELGEEFLASGLAVGGGGELGGLAVADMPVSEDADLARSGRHQMKGTSRLWVAA